MRHSPSLGEILVSQTIALSYSSVDAIPLADSSMDFGYSLGVLHHVPDTASCHRIVREEVETGRAVSHFLYYSVSTNKPRWVSHPLDGLRRGEAGRSRLPPRRKHTVADVARVR